VNIKQSSFLLLSMVAVGLVGCDDGGPSATTVGAGSDASDPGRNVVSRLDGGLTIADDAATFTDAGTIVTGDKDVVINSIDPVEDKTKISVLKAGDFRPNVQVVIPVIPADEIGSLVAQVGDALGTSFGAAQTLNQVGIADTATRPGVRIFTFANTPVSLSGLPSGGASLRFTVLMRSGKMASKTVPIIVDAGPTIKFISPLDGQFYKGQTLVEVEVTDLVSPPVTDVEVAIGDYKLTLVKEGNLYRATVLFDAPVFQPSLEGAQLLTARAKNATQNSSVAVRRFTVDNLGPSITETVPGPGVLIGGIVELSATVTDPAGLDTASVVAVVAHGDQSFQVKMNPPLVGGAPNQFTGVFDGNKIPDNVIFPVVSFRASDKLGNESTVGYLTSFDNNPPVLELDPPESYREESEFNGFPSCSYPFDPVGPDAVDDGQKVGQTFNVRVRVEDQGNRTVSGDAKFVPIAGTATVDLLVYDKPDRALVVDTDSDHLDAMGNPTINPITNLPRLFPTCDALNPLLRPSTRPVSDDEVLQLALTVMDPKGDADYTGQAPDNGGIACSYYAGVTTQPASACGPTTNYYKGFMNFFSGPNGEDLVLARHGHTMTAYMSYTVGKQGSIWTVGPINPTSECAGRQIDALGANLKDGWLCLAAVAQDKLGKKQVSKPIRVCVDHDNKGNECPHINIVRATKTKPIGIETAVAHGFATGDEVYVQEVPNQIRANGAHVVTVTSPTTFTLSGTFAYPLLPEGSSGMVVRKNSMPDCVGVQTAKGQTPVVDHAGVCEPWRVYGEPEIRRKN